MSVAKATSRLREHDYYKYVDLVVLAGKAI